MKKAASDESPRFHNLVSELKACGRVGTRTGGREEPEEKHLVDKRQNIYNTGLPLDEHKTRKLKISPVEESNRRRQKGQEQRDDNQQGKVQKEESLNV